MADHISLRAAALSIDRRIAVQVACQAADLNTQAMPLHANQATVWSVRYRTMSRAIFSESSKSRDGRTITALNRCYLKRGCSTGFGTMVHGEGHK
jgi:hypothetical protein